LQNARCLRGGIDAWAQEVDVKMRITNWVDSVLKFLRIKNENIFNCSWGSCPQATILEEGYEIKLRDENTFTIRANVSSEKIDPLFRSSVTRLPEPIF
jgi:hypothetical protein